MSQYPTSPESMPGVNQPAPVCRRHPDRVSYIRCQRCGNPVCPSCQRAAAVGVQCPDCVQSAAAAMPTQRSVMGGAVAQGAPLVTYGLIATCIAVFLGQNMVPGFTNEIALSSASGDGNPWRLLTSAFAHGSVIHILFNMYALYITGSVLEPLLGRLRFAALAALSALGGSVAFLLSQPLHGGSSVVGASGAVFGLFTAYLLIARSLGRDVSGITAVIAINFALPLFLPNIAWQAHVGGAITGAAVAGAILLGRRTGRQLVGWATMTGILLVIVALYFVHYAG